MSDTTGWTSPSGEEPSGSTSPGTPPPSPPGGLPPAPPPPDAYGPPPGWTPPPKPGLIPLAPMTLGTLLGAAFRVLRRNPRPVIGFSLVIHIILALISIAVTLLFTVSAIDKYSSFVESTSTGDISQASVSGAIGSLLVAQASTFITAIFTYAGESILQGVITMEVARGTVGEKLPLSALWARARGRIAVLLGWAGLTILVAIVALGIVGGGIVLLIAFGGVTGAVIGGILAFVAYLGGLVLLLWVTTKLSLVPSALVIERLTLVQAIRRSWDLVKGFFWRTLGIELLVSLIVGVASFVIELPVGLVVEIATAASNPTGLATSGSALGAITNAGELATTTAAALIATVTAIISTATAALIYLDLRMRKEGLDLALMRFVDARAAGATDVPDPYLTADSARPPAADRAA